MTNEDQAEAPSASPRESPDQRPSADAAPVHDADHPSRQAAAEGAAQASPDPAAASSDQPHSVQVRRDEPAPQEDKTAEDGATDAAGEESAAKAPPDEAGKRAKRPKRPALIVRYGVMGMVGRFAYSLERWRRGQRVVIKSDRGMEIGTIVCRGSGSADRGPKLRGEVLRLVTHTDEVEERHLAESAKRELRFCKQCVAEHKLPMKLVEAEHLFGGDRIVFYFVSESRVDFRALVNDLAREFQTRIEMRQVGVRDEARLLGDYERCGRPLCCRAWLKNLEPVSMKMAKIQKATLDPAKISGRCGRLMCCLRYEHATYGELAKNLPRRNTVVGTQQGRGKVVALHVVAQMVGVLLESGTRVNVPVETLVPPEEALASERDKKPQVPEPQADAAPETAALADRGPGREPKAGGEAAGAKSDDAGDTRSRSNRRRRRRSKRSGRNRAKEGGAGPSDASARTPKAANQTSHPTPQRDAKPRDSQGT